MSGILYVIGTPIGNLQDLSPRAVETLRQIDFIAAEDTRVTVKLLNHFEIKKPMISYFEHNKHIKGEIIINRILSGEICGLVTDAGMPAISDPGQELVAQCAEAGITVLSIPGPTAMTTALAVSGLPTGRFTFEGFLSMNKKNRMQHLNELKSETRTMVFYEAPHKLNATLTDLYAAFGERRIALVREITKIHEETIRTTLSNAAVLYEETPPKGEFVLVIEGTPPTKQTESFTLDDAVKKANALIKSGEKAASAAKIAAAETGIKKSEIYKIIADKE
ncbi:MAG: 16S rRNA (cytidine(1402)-2'-O)-methyltransferase [Bacillota bacterium]|nr:16S rRNA (cytidine(1402)-2'-O)-methyltransferase [Bacillota bacterium]